MVVRLFARYDVVPRFRCSVFPPESLESVGMERARADEFLLTSSKHGYLY